MIKLKLKEDVTDWSEGTIRCDYETGSDEKLIEAFAKRGYEIDPDTAYKAWLAFSMSWDASWLFWQGDSDELMEQYWKFLEVVV